MNHFVSKWGYWAVFLGSLIEGESIILPAGYFCAKGLLDFKTIVLIAFIGTLIADQSLFTVGHYLGPKFLKKYPKIQPIVGRVFDFLKHYGSFYVLIFRFIYGVRIMSPVIIGASGFPFSTFALLNVIAAAFWSFTSCGAGYIFGDFLIYYLSPLQRFIVLGSFGIFCLSYLLWKAFLFFRENGNRA